MFVEGNGCVFVYKVLRMKERCLFFFVYIEFLLVFDSNGESFLEYFRYLLFIYWSY